MFQPSSKHPDLSYHAYEAWMPWISRRPRNREHGGKHQRFLDLGEPQQDFPLQPIAAMGMDTDSGCVVFLKFGDFKWMNCHILACYCPTLEVQSSHSWPRLTRRWWRTRSLLLNHSLQWWGMSYLVIRQNWKIWPLGQCGVRSAYSLGAAKCCRHSWSSEGRSEADPHKAIEPELTSYDYIQHSNCSNALAKPYIYISST